MKRNLTDVFLENLRSLPIRKENKIRECLLDYIGVLVAGKNFYRTVVDVFKNSIIGGEIANSALLNGICAHAIELDDGHRFGMLHLEAPIFSALMAVVEEENVRREDFEKGVIIGYETAIRLASAVQPGHKLKGYHATGTCGTIGVAMGIAAMLHFDKEQSKSAFSAACTSAAGLLEMIEGDSQMKPYNVGRAAMDGVIAAYIGKARFKAPEDALGGKRGFLKVMTDEPRLEYLTVFSGDKYMIEGIYQKPYAACRHCHPSIEAALHIRQQSGFDVNAVESIQVDTYKLAVGGHDHTDIIGVNSAKMSIPYSLAVALCTGKAGLDEYTENIISKNEILAITEKVRVKDVDELTELCPQKRVAIVTVKTSNGDYCERVDYPKGEPENPLSREELEDKFRGLAMYGGLTEQECEEIINEVWKEDFDLNKIMKIICK